jgi:hypothetical protein
VDSTSKYLTIAIAAAAVVQAFYAAKLFQFQRKLESDRTRTSVGATFELRRPDPSKPQQAWIRIDNSSAVGIEHERLELFLIAKGRGVGPDFLDLRMSVAPWSSREIEITDEFEARAMKIDTGDLSWNSGPHSVDVMLKPHYAADNGRSMGSSSFYRVEFSAQNLQSVRSMTERAYDEVMAAAVVFPGPSTELRKGETP